MRATRHSLKGGGDIKARLSKAEKAKLSAMAQRYTGGNESAVIRAILSATSVELFRLIYSTGSIEDGRAMQ